MNRRLPSFAAPLWCALLTACTRHHTPDPPLAAEVAAESSPSSTPPEPAATSESPAADTPAESHAMPSLPHTPPSPLGPSRGRGRTFATELFAQTMRRSGNQALSAPNVHAALSVLALGARGPTEALMRRTLELPAAPDARLKELKERNAHWPAQAGEAILHSSARLWLAEQSTPLESYLRSIDALGASVERVNFVADADRARQRINQWIEQETRGLIPELLPPGSVAPSTEATATTTLYFKGLWQTQFQPYATQPRPFLLAGGTRATVPTMHTTETFAAHAGSDFVAVTLPYRGSSLRMTLVRATDGKPLESLERRYIADGLAPLLKHMPSVRVSLSLPKFALSAGGIITDALEAMGLGPAFGPDADFHGALPSGALRLEGVVHRVVVIVDEAGTEAAAATAAVLGSGGMPEKPLSIAFDRPFLFFLHDPAGEVLLAGRLLDPR